MSRNGSGVYSLPAGYSVVNGDVSDALQHTPILEDIATDLNTARPVVVGGTGAGTVGGARDNLFISGKVLSKSAGYTAVAGDRAKLINCTATLTLALTAAATLGDGWFAIVKASTGDVTIDPNASETIDGAATLVVYEGQSATITCNGTAFFSSNTVAGALTSIDINGGTIDGATIATSDITVGAAKTLDVSAGTLTLADDQIAGAKVAASTTSSEGVVQIIDEDDMISDSETRPPTQQSVKAYVDANSITQISGTAPYYGARAFANFYWDGAAIVIRASGNVTSIARTTTGVYTVTLTTAMSDANYTIVGNYSTDDSSPSGTNNDGQLIPSDRTTTTFKVHTVNGSGGSVDSTGSCNVVIFG